MKNCEPVGGQEEGSLTRWNTKNLEIGIKVRKGKDQTPMGR